MFIYVNIENKRRRTEREERKCGEKYMIIFVLSIISTSLKYRSSVVNGFEV